jgi:hypothetical protein
MVRDDAQIVLRPIEWPPSAVMTLLRNADAGAETLVSLIIICDGETPKGRRPRAAILQAFRSLVAVVGK